MKLVPDAYFILILPNKLIPFQFCLHVTEINPKLQSTNIYISTFHVRLISTHFYIHNVNLHVISKTYLFSFFPNPIPVLSNIYFYHSYTITSSVMYKQYQIYNSSSVQNVKLFPLLIITYYHYNFNKSLPLIFILWNHLFSWYLILLRKHTILWGKVCDLCASNFRGFKKKFHREINLWTVVSNLRGSKRKIQFHGVANLWCVVSNFSWF